MRIQEIMRTDVHCVTPDDYARAAYQLMIKYEFRHLPVVNDKGKLVGVVSDRDIRNVTVHFEKRPRNPSEYIIDKSIRVRDVMTSNPVTIKPTDDVQLAVELMLKNHFGCLPIVDGETLAGLVTQSDLLRLLGKFLSKPR